MKRGSPAPVPSTAERNARWRATGSLRQALGDFVDELCAADFTELLGQRKPTRRLKHLLPHPARGSACKRLNLFLRWMIRGPSPSGC